MAGPPANEWWKKTPGSSGPAPDRGAWTPPPATQPPGTPWRDPPSSPPPAAGSAKKKVKIGALIVSVVGVLSGIVGLGTGVKSFLGLDVQPPGPTVIVPNKPEDPKPVTGRVMIPPGWVEHVRVYPTVHAEIIAELQNGVPVTILCVAQGDVVIGSISENQSSLWDRVDIGNATGYLPDVDVFTGTNEAQAPNCFKK